MKPFAVLLLLSTFMTLGRTVSGICCNFGEQCYPHGAVIPDLCFRLTCDLAVSKEPRWTIDGPDKHCARCKIWNKWPVFKTFDNQFFIRPGKCNYTLTQYPVFPPTAAGYDPETGIFAHFKNCIPNVPIFRCFDETTYKVDDFTDVKIYHEFLEATPPEIRINNVGHGIGWPSETLTDSVIGGKLGAFTFLQGPHYSMIISPWYMIIWTPPQFINRECGLCGLYSGTPIDDFTTRDNIFNPSEFFHSWLTDAQQHDCCYEKKREVTTECKTSEADTKYCTDSFKTYSTDSFMTYSTDSFKTYSKSSGEDSYVAACKTVMCNEDSAEKTSAMSDLTAAAEAEKQFNEMMLNI